MSLENEVRREETQRELAYLQEALTSWLEHRRTRDRDGRGEYIGRHKTQLQALESTLIGSVTALQSGLADVDANQTAGSFYADCRAYDQAAVWLERAWEYYREKFDQRDDERLGPLVRAADEVIWSCYRQVFAQAELRAPTLKQGAVPLAFVEPEYSPAARLAHRVPPDLRPSARFLQEFLRTLPVPLLRLPPWCVEAPWWLVFVAHEVGHYVVYDLELLSHFRAAIREAARGQGLTETEQKRWEAWTEEIFADLFAVVMIGPWALWSMIEVEWGPPALMVRRRAAYPAPVVRLKVLAETINALQLDGDQALRGVSLEQIADTDKTAKRDMLMAKEVAQLVLEPLPHNLGTLAGLGRFDARAFEPSGTVASMAAVLEGRPAVLHTIHPGLETPRYLVSGALQAWSRLMGASKAERRQRRAELADKTIRNVIRNGEPGTRSQMVPDGRVPEKGIELAQRLMAWARNGPTAAEG